MIPVEEDFLVTFSDVKAAGYCMKGMRDWCVLHGISVTTAIARGVSARVLAALDDAIANRVIEVAQKRRRIRK